MSRIIKNSQIVANPRLIEAAKLPDLESMNINKEKPEWEAAASPKTDQEKLNLEQLKGESEKIIRETEEMVVELLNRAREEARLIIADAQEEADNIRARLYEEAQEIRKEAYEEGYAEGLKKAWEEMEEKLAEARQKSEQIVEEARQLKLSILNSVEKDIVKLALAIAKKIVVAELKSNPESILEVVREAISFLDQPENVTLRVNPEDMELLTLLREKGDFNDIENEVANFEIKTDNRISPGGAIIESDKGIVDAQLETRIASIEEALGHEFTGE